MDALEAILTRHSVAKVKPDPVPHEIIEKLLHAAVQAPNHYRVRPWRFVVLTGKSRQALGEILAQALKKQNPELPDAGMEIERAKPLRAPVLIAVGVDKPDRSESAGDRKYLCSGGGSGKPAAGCACRRTGRDVAHRLSGARPGSKEIPGFFSRTRN